MLILFQVNIIKCDALRGLVPFAQFKKHKKNPWKNVSFSKVATLLKLTPFHGCFSRFLDCTNGTKLCNASQMELNELQTNPYLRSKSNSGDKFLQEFYAKYLKVSANFPNVINHAKKMFCWHICVSAL